MTVPSGQPGEPDLSVPVGDWVITYENDMVEIVSDPIFKHRFTEVLKS